jgi:hypothetical protein
MSKNHRLVMGVFPKDVSTVIPAISETTHDDKLTSMTAACRVNQQTQRFYANPNSKNRSALLLWHGAC